MYFNWNVEMVVPSTVELTAAAKPSEGSQGRRKTALVMEQCQAVFLVMVFNLHSPHAELAFETCLFMSFVQ